MTTGAESPGGDKVAAFFDVDNTIIRGASAFHIARGLRSRGFLTTRDILRFGWEQAKYLMLGESKAQNKAIRQEALSIIKGWSVAEMTQIGEEVYDEVLALRIFPGTQEILSSHLDAGHEVWLVTASPIEIGKLISRRIGATGALGTIAEHKRGKYTGRLVGDMMHGKSKAKGVARLAAERGFDLSKSFAYGDSSNDVPMLERVGNPCAINPDMRLRKTAKERNWAIKDFRGKRGNGRRNIAVRAAAGALWLTVKVCGGIKNALLRVFRRGDATD